MDDVAVRPHAHVDAGRRKSTVYEGASPFSKRAKAGKAYSKMGRFGAGVPRHSSRHCSPG